MSNASDHGRNGDPFFLPLLILIGIEAVILSFCRFVAADEGFYLLAARLIHEGQLPYRDFLYPQAPYYPFLLRGWFALFETTWNSARLFAAAQFFGIAILFYLTVRRVFSRALALFGVLILLTGEAAIGWFTVAKPYGLVALLLVALFSMLLAEWEGIPFRQKVWRAGGAGVLLAVAVGVRSYLIVLFPVVVLFLWIFRRKEDGAASSVAFLGGFVLGVTPFLVMISVFPRESWFNNIQFHLLRSSLSPAAAWQQKGALLSALLGVRSHQQLAPFQYPALFIGTGTAVILLGKNLLARNLRSLDREAIFLAILFSAVLTGVSLVPTPAWFQYFAIVYPFLLFSTLGALHLCHSVTPLLTGVGGVAIVLCSITPFFTVLHRYTATGVGVPTVHRRALESSRLSGVQEVQHRVDELTAPGDYVFSRWPGFLLESKVRPYPGSENQFWTRVTDRISSQQAREFHLFERSSMRTLVEQRKVRLIVIRPRYLNRLFSETLLTKNGYEFIEERAGVRFYGLPQDSRW
ncbi:glycosyltransferase family 39 protein [bacterium]|nr:glycosyltransferase family 39 protein [bacterium]